MFALALVAAPKRSFWSDEKRAGAFASGIKDGIGYRRIHTNDTDFVDAHDTQGIGLVSYDERRTIEEQEPCAR